MKLLTLISLTLLGSLTASCQTYVEQTDVTAYVQGLERKVDSLQAVINAIPPCVECDYTEHERTIRALSGEVDRLTVLLAVPCADCPACPEDSVIIPDPDPTANFTVTNNSTLLSAISQVSPGQTIVMRGGTYNPFSITRNGEAGKLIRLQNYPGERVIINGATLTNSGARSALTITGDYWHLKGIEITGTKQHSSAYQSFGIRATDVKGCVFEELVIHNIEGPGLGIYGNSPDNLVLNCDSYDNYDPLTTRPGDDADGFAIGRASGENNVFRGNRAWNNSDDGIDCFGTTGFVLIENNWSFNNGNHQGNGQGIKLGSSPSSTRTLRMVKDNLSAFNRSGGFDQSEAQCILEFYGNVAYRNARGWWLYQYNLPHVLQRNITYGSGNYFVGDRLIHSGNSWDSTLSPALSDSDFSQITFTNLTKPRVNGQLPDLKYRKL